MWYIFRGHSAKNKIRWLLLHISQHICQCQDNYTSICIYASGSLIHFHMRLQNTAKTPQSAIIKTKNFFFIQLDLKVNINSKSGDPLYCTIHYS